MKTIEIYQTPDANGMLHVSIPAEDASREYILRVEVLPATPTEEELQKRGWSPGFFEATAGKWVGDFPEDYEGDFEEREEL